MATTISTQDIIDAKRDIDDIGKAVNENVIVDPRYGADFKSLPMIAVEAQATIGEWQDAINTIVVNDGVPALAVSSANGENQQDINDYNGAKWRNKAGGYSAGDRVRLLNGDVVISTIASNKNNPNTDTAGWLNIDNSITVDTIADMLAIKNPEKWAKVCVRSYNVPNYALANPFRGGGLFYYSPSKANVNDGGIVINGWIRQFDQKSVLVDWFGADGVDDTLAIQRAINYSGASPVNLEVHFASYIYRVYDEITAESANRRNLTLVGTHNGYAGSLAYDFRNTNAGSVILSYAEGASTLFNINDGRYNNGQVHVKNIAIVGNYWDFQNQTTGTTAFKIAKADAAHPDDTWYKVNYLFEQVSFVNCFYPIKFTSPLTAPDHTMAKNFIGDTLLSRCSAYGCGYYFVAENTSFNRLTVRDNFLFGLTRQAFATKTLDGLNPSSPEYLQQLIRMKIENTHFEGVRGMFNFMNLVGDFEDSRSSIEISNVTREASSLYENGTGTALGLVKDVDFIISGRFEDIGWNEQTGLLLGEGCTIQSMFNLNPLLPNAFSSKSPTTINCAIDSNTHTVAAGSTKTLTFISYNTFDFVDMDFVVNFKAPNGSGLGMKKYVVSGATATTASQTLAESGGVSYAGLSVTASLSGPPEYILTLVVENVSAAAVTVDTKLVRNVFGNKLYGYAS